MSYPHISAVILAAGKGTRMKSELPKVAHTVNGKPMVLYPIHTLQSMNVGQILCVVKHGAEVVKPIVEEHATICYQEGGAYGTAKAVEAACPSVADEIQDVMVFNGDDSAFYTKETVESVLKHHLDTKSTITFVTLKLENPSGYGRILYDENHNFQQIIEEKDATEDQKSIQEVNDGLYIFNKEFLIKNISNIPPSPVTGEYYLTDLLTEAVKQGKKVSTHLLDNSEEFFGISTQEDLARANAKMQNLL